MIKYKFRAECAIDVSRFKDAIEGTDIVIDTEINFPDKPDVLVEINTWLDETAIIRIMKKIPDSHVMIRTLEFIN